MINIDYLTLRDFFQENIDFLIGARIQKIQQPTRRDFIFSLRNLGNSRKLYININPQIYHIAFMTQKGENRRSLEIPKHPPMFCMLLRKYIEGCKIDDARVIDNERILELFFEVTDELSQKRSLCLCVELMGKHSNIILYDRTSNIIIGCAHNIGSEKSRYRELQGGLKYIYPPVHPLKNNIPCLYKVLNYPAACSINEILDDYFSKAQEELNIREKKAQLQTFILPKYKKTKHSIEKITLLLKKRDNTEKYKLYGELLTANLYKNNNYQKEIEVYDYINNQNINIELDETKNLKENAQKYFKLYNKSKTTKEKSEEMLQTLLMEYKNYENILYSIDTASSLEEIDEIRLEIEPNLKINKKPHKLDIIKLDINGFNVFIGKNNRQNDYIISKLAKDEDYWFHTRTCAGSHVLLKINEKEPDENTIFECCKLARKYSSAKQPSKVGIIYTKAKFLRKPPASPLGYVTYKNEKEILV